MTQKIYSINLIWQSLNISERCRLVKYAEVSMSTMYSRLANPQLFKQEELQIIARFLSSLFDKPMAPADLLTVKFSRESKKIDILITCNDIAEVELLANSSKLSLGFKLKERELFQPSEIDQHAKITRDTEFFRSAYIQIKKQYDVHSKVIG